MNSILFIPQERADESECCDQWDLTLKVLSPPKGPLAQFKISLDTPASKLAPGEGWKEVGKVLTWPFVKKVLLNLARQNDHIALLKATKHDTEAVQLRLDQISEKLVRVQLNVADEKSRRSLRAPDPSLSYNKAQEDRHPEIGAWFTASEAFETWKIGPKPFLGLYGILGCGTSVFRGISHLIKGCDEMYDSIPK